MSLRALPILFVNMGGEMIYILDQRLSAQKIPSHKAQKVLNDIIGTMHNSRFVEELFQPQEMYSKQMVKQAFDKLAHASIMRLNTSSMDKLYDLITMAFKFQILSCPRPSDILLVTLNHLDSMRAMVNSELIARQLDNVYRLLVKHYGTMTESEFQHIRYTMLGFFQDIHIRVSMFLRDTSQNPNGRFVVPVSGPVPFGTEVPGSIRLFNANGDLATIRHFQNGGHYQAASKAGSLESKGNRGTTLGTNLYTTTKPEECVLNSPGELPNSPTKAVEVPTLAKEELDLLALLIGGNSKTTPEKAEFRLNLCDFSSGEDQDSGNKQETKENILNLAASKTNDELSRIMGEMDDHGTTVKRQVNAAAADDDDLLNLMDSACK